jgi:hypothetical protein
VFYLAGHHRLGHAFLVHQVDGFAEFAEADPVDAPGEIRKFRRSFLF